MKNKKLLLIVIFAFIFITINSGYTQTENLVSQARSAFYENNYEEAEKLWLETKDKGINEWEANFFLGMVYLRKDQLQKAANYMDNAYNLRTDDYYTLVNYARILYRKNDYKSAREKLDKVPEDLRDYNEQFYNIHGLLEMAENNLKQAVEYFNKAIKINPKNYYVQNNLGLTLIRTQNYEQAKTHLELAADEKPQKAYVYNNLGISYENLNQLYKAKQSYEKALDLNPDHKKAEINLKRVISKIND